MGNGSVIRWGLFIEAMFLVSGETSASLNLDGKVPSKKERLARVEMSSEKIKEQDFISEVGIKS